MLASERTRLQKEFALVINDTGFVELHQRDCVSTNSHHIDYTATVREPAEPNVNGEKKI